MHALTSAPIGQVLPNGYACTETAKTLQEAADHADRPPCPLVRTGMEPVWRGAFRGSSTSTPFLFAVERLPCGKGVYVISPANDLSILDRDDGHESVVIRSARFDGFAMNLIFQNDHAAFLVVVNCKPITFFKNDVVTVTRVGGNQIFSPVNHFRPTGEAI